jgi:hypothetical protein
MKALFRLSRTGVEISCPFLTISAEDEKRAGASGAFSALVVTGIAAFAQTDLG